MIRYILLSLVIITLAFTDRKIEEKPALIVHVSNIEKVTGNLMVAIFENEAKFPDADYALQQIVFPVNGTTTSFKIKDLVVGTSYAIAVYHDKNKNQKLDKNFLGIPTERYGFSNDARELFGPPSFKSASFVFNTSNIEHRIKIE